MIRTHLIKIEYKSIDYELFIYETDGLKTVFINNQIICTIKKDFKFSWKFLRGTVNRYHAIFVINWILKHDFIKN